LFHTELVLWLVMELGGAYSFEVELEKVALATLSGARLLMRAAELALKVSLVGEALSISALSASRHAASHALTQAVLDRLLRDEGAHSQLGHWFFGWAAERLDDADRVHLAGVARAAVAVYAPLWQAPACERCVLPREAGGAGADVYQAALREAVDRRIAPALARWGISLDPRVS
jgi:hypothetical protein